MSYQEVFNARSQSFLLEILDPLRRFIEEEYEIEISEDKLIRFLDLPKNKAPASAAPGYQTPSGARGGRGRAKAEPRPQCTFITAKNGLCTKKAAVDNTYCATHIKAAAKKVSEVKKNAETTFFVEPSQGTIRTEIFDLKNNLSWERVRGFVFRSTNLKRVIGVYDINAKKFRGLNSEEEEQASNLGLEIEEFSDEFESLHPPTTRVKASPKNSKAVPKAKIFIDEEPVKKPSRKPKEPTEPLIPKIKKAESSDEEPSRIPKGIKKAESSDEEPSPRGKKSIPPQKIQAEDEQDPPKPTSLPRQKNVVEIDEEEVTPPKKASKKEIEEEVTPPKKAPINRKEIEEEEVTPPKKASKKEIEEDESDEEQFMPKKKLPTASLSKTDFEVGKSKSRPLPVKKMNTKPIVETDSDEEIED